MTGSLVAVYLSLSSILASLAEDAVRFPDSPTPSYNRVSPCPQNEMFCESVPDYPRRERVDNDLIENRLVKDKIFDEKGYSGYRAFAELQTRTFTFPEQRACRFTRSQIFPKKAVNTQGEYVFIVNDDQYRQSVEIEQCEEEGLHCNTDEDAPSSSNTVCRQKYTIHKLYAITANKEQIYDSFSLPSACICYYKNPFKSNIGFRSSFRASRPSGPRLPFCRDGTRLDLPRFVSSEPSLGGENLIRRTSSAGRPFVHQAGSREDRSRISRDFVYPGQRQRDARQRRERRRNSSRRRQSSAPRLSTGCLSSGKSYCEDTTDNTNYPADLARSLLSKNPAVGQNLFRQVFDNECTNTIGTRFFSIEDEQLCRGRQKVIFPRTALNLNNEWRFVVNIDNFTQAVEIEECEESYDDFGSDSEFGSCLYGGSYGDDPSRTSCRQIFTEYKLLSLSHNSQLEVDRFKLPSACACYIRESFSLEV